MYGLRLETLNKIVPVKTNRPSNKEEHAVAEYADDDNSLPPPIPEGLK